MTTASNKSAGRQWERYVDTEIESMNAIALGYWARSPEPIRPLRSLGEGRIEAVYSKKAEPDYYGILPGGQGVVFDAKLVTDSDRFDFSRLAVHQLEAMKRCARAGGLAFVYVGRWPEQEKYILPVDADGAICGVRDRRHVKFDRLSGLQKLRGEYLVETIRRISETQDWR
jgi:penicillin-binding protein-related factor A (putative recombinase)